MSGRYRRHRPALVRLGSAWLALRSSGKGEGPAAARRLERERADLRRTLDRIQADAPELDARRVTRATAAGDGARLRGLPAIGRGVRGAMSRAAPGANLE